jgi:tRNA G26 N,N-dimethylase Trm1
MMEGSAQKASINETLSNLMLCEKCQQRDARVFLTSIVEHVPTKSNLCEACFEATSPAFIPKLPELETLKITPINTEQALKIVEYLEKHMKTFAPAPALGSKIYWTEERRDLPPIRFRSMDPTSAILSALLILSGVLILFLE